MACSALGSRIKTIEDEIEAMEIGDSERIILQNITCASDAAVGQFVVLSGSGAATVVTNNKITIIPNGVSGMIYEKSSATVCKVLVRGRITLSSLPAGDLFISTTGTITATAPATGVVQCIGKRISSSDLLFDPRTPIHRDTDTP